VTCPLGPPRLHKRCTNGAQTVHKRLGL
jgi:hypothetical protein